MKTIGILGGMSAQSTSVYYQRINEEINEQLKKAHSAQIVLYSFDFQIICELQHANNWSMLVQLLGEKAKLLENAKAELLVIATNTMHKILPDLQQIIHTPFVSIIDATIEKIKKEGCQQVLLLGTLFTMSDDMYKQACAKQNIGCVTVDETSQKLVHDIIYNELIVGIINKKSKAIIEEIVERYSHVQGVILGCTELPLLKCDFQDKIIFDTTDIHIHAIVKEALKVD